MGQKWEQLKKGKSRGQRQEENLHCEDGIFQLRRKAKRDVARRYKSLLRAPLFKLPSPPLDAVSNWTEQRLKENAFWGEIEEKGHARLRCIQYRSQGSSKTANKSAVQRKESVEPSVGVEEIRGKREERSQPLYAAATSIFFPLTLFHSIAKAPIAENAAHATET
jgi:hypothetical protein